MAHYCTIFDYNYLPIGLNLIASLRAFSGGRHTLWVLAIDEDCAKLLNKLGLQDLKVLSLNALQDERLMRIKAERNRAELCWTLKSFFLEYLLTKKELSESITYLDADLYFFDNPQILIDDFYGSNKDVMITDHRYDPIYDDSQLAGKYCAQLLSFKQSPAALDVLGWWKSQCVEWCGQVPEPGRFGDQKYLEQFVVLFPNSIYVSNLQDRLLAPWNVGDIYKSNGANINPLLYHFHGFKILKPGRYRLFLGYRIPRSVQYLYDDYIAALEESLRCLYGFGYKVKEQEALGWIESIKVAIRRIKGNEKLVSTSI